MADPASEPNPDAPRKVTIDNQSVEGHSLREQIEAADRRDAKAIAKKGGLGIRFNKVRPGGAV